MRVEKKTKIYLFGILVVVIGVIIGIIPIFLKQEEEQKEKTKIEEFMIDTSIEKEDTKQEEPIKEEQPKEEDNYLLVLEIPKISLKRGVYPKESYLNSIEYNVAIMKESTLPTTENGNVVLAAHNGTARISYFNQLHRITLNDKAYIYYEGVKYTYVVANIYDVAKDGDVEVKRDKNKNTLTLITCKKDTDDRQLIIILYLEKKEEY